MKVGDLVRYIEVSDGGDLGLIMEAARHGQPSYKIWWTALNKTGWWDSHRLELVSEKSS